MLIGRMWVLPSKTPRPCNSFIAVAREKPGLYRRWRRSHKSQMAISRSGKNAAARRALHKALLHQIGFDNLLDGVARLAQGCGDGFDPHRPAIEVFRNQRKITAVKGVQSP